MKRLLKYMLVVSCLGVEVVYANMVISPTQMYLGDKARQRSATVVMEATDLTEPKSFEMFAYKWSQNAQGEDVLEPEQDLLINPKNFVLQPKTQQIIRVGFSRPLTKEEMAQERIWRIIFKEIAPVVEEDTLQFLFTISVPLFVGKQDAINVTATPRYQNNRLFLEIENHAASHVQISSISILDQKRQAIATSSEMKYLLNQQKHSFDMGQIKLSDLKNYILKLETDKSEQAIELKMKG
jgi:fimbrial chaperone protein